MRVALRSWSWACSARRASRRAVNRGDQLAKLLLHGVEPGVSADRQLGRYRGGTAEDRDLDFPGDSKLAAGDPPGGSDDPADDRKVTVDHLAFEAQVTFDEALNVIEVSGDQVAADGDLALLTASHPPDGDEVGPAFDGRGFDQAVDLDLAGGLDGEAVAYAPVNNDVAGEIDVPGGEVDIVGDLEHLPDAEFVVGKIDDPVGLSDEPA